MNTPRESRGEEAKIDNPELFIPVVEIEDVVNGVKEFTSEPKIDPDTMLRPLNELLGKNFFYLRRIDTKMVHEEGKASRPVFEVYLSVGDGERKLNIPPDPARYNMRPAGLGWAQAWAYLIKYISSLTPDQVREIRSGNDSLLTLREKVRDLTRG